MAVELLGMGLLHALPGLDQAQELGTAEQLLLMLQVCVCLCVFVCVYWAGPGTGAGHSGAAAAHAAGVCV